MSFLKGFFSSCLGALVALFVFVFGIVLFFALSSSDAVIVNPKSVLHLRLAQPISELELDDELANLFPDIAETRMGLLQLKEVLRAASADTNIEGVYLDLTQIPAGFSSVREMREAILQFRESGKWVIAWSDNYSEGSYYLASAASEVYLYPHGMIEFNGLSVEVMHFKKLFDKLDIKPEVFRVGDFKSAVEPYLLERMSNENRLQLNALLQSIHAQMLQDISATRNISLDRLVDMASTMKVRNSLQAQQNSLVDSLLYNNQVRDIIRQKLGVEKDKAISLIKYSDYKRSLNEEANGSPDQISVIVADGEIMPGTSALNIVGSNTMVQEIRKARISKKVKAIVLRVNSPGGSFQAADEMWHELRLAAEEKPVIASMSDYAASGGYYLAMACDTIVAQPTTITGSIGIFSVLFDLSGFLENKIGVTSDLVKTGEVGDLITFTRPLTDLEKSIWQNQTNELYDVFITKASQGRHMNEEAIRKIASGRVWTGEQAQANGLVDVLGDFEQAVELAARAAKIDSYQLRYYPEPQTFLERLTQETEKSIKSRSMKSELGDLYTWYVQWNKLQQHQGVQARMPFQMTIQ